MAKLDQTPELAAHYKAIGQRGQEVLLQRFQARIDADPEYANFTPEQRAQLARAAKRMWLQAVGRTGGRPKRQPTREAA